jgi:hypothetical protein
MIMFSSYKLVSCDDHKFWSENLNEREHLEDLGIDGRILKWILMKQNGRAWTGFHLAQDRDQ